MSVPVKQGELALHQSTGLATVDSKQVGQRLVTYISVVKDDKAHGLHRWIRWDSRTDIVQIARSCRLVLQRNGVEWGREKAIAAARVGVLSAIEIETSHVAACLIRELVIHDKSYKHSKWAEKMLSERYSEPDVEPVAEPDDAPDEIYTVAECRRNMQRYHPDRGGNRELFELWCGRLDEAKAREARA